MQVKLGQQVGYSIRFENKTNEETKIQFFTDGKLLKEFIKDPELKEFSCIIIDEAHERTIDSDLLMSLLKQLIQHRKDLKIIISSATLNAQKFQKYFNDCPIINVPGRRFDVDIYYTKQPEADYIQAAILTILQIHITQPEGDILVFFTGQEEIETALGILLSRQKKFGKNIMELLILPLYSNLPQEMQSKIFQKTPKNTRKIVLSTNIAETSLTIDNIVYVIDCGFCKENNFNPKLEHSTLVITPISKASADQRAGRAGRVRPGKCFRLYTQWSFKNQLEEISTPEIQRSDLSSMILTLKGLGIENLVEFDFLDAPNSQTLIQALNHLFNLSILNQDGELTEIGNKILEFPLTPSLSKSMIFSEQYQCIKQFAIIVGVLTVGGGVFYRPKDQILYADTAKKRFDMNDDILSYLKIFQDWEESGFSQQFCKQNFLQFKTLAKVRNIKDQILKICQSIGIDIEDEKLSNEKNQENNIRDCFLEGFFMNIARQVRKNTYATIKKRKIVQIHPSSFCSTKNYQFICFCEVVLTQEEYMRHVIEVNSEQILKISNYYSQEELENKEKKRNLKDLLAIEKKKKVRYKDQLIT